jgi:hypothetical protein
MGPPAAAHKLFTLWTHDETFSRHQVLVNPEHFPDLRVDDLLEIFHPSQPQPPRKWSFTSYSEKNSNSRTEVADRSKRLIVKVQIIDREIIAKQSQLQVRRSDEQL